MDAESYLIAISLFALGLLLAILSVRGILRYYRTGVRPQLMWGSGLALAAAAMAVEGIVYVGIVNSPLLQSYVFFSAAIVGATRPEQVRENVRASGISLEHDVLRRIDEVLGDQIVTDPVLTASPSARP